jgi:hypothetical protein
MQTSKRSYFQYVSASRDHSFSTPSCYDSQTIPASRAFPLSAIPRMSNNTTNFASWDKNPALEKWLPKADVKYTAEELKWVYAHLDFNTKISYQSIPPPLSSISTSLSRSEETRMGKRSRMVLAHERVRSVALSTVGLCGPTLSMENEFPFPQGRMEEEMQMAPARCRDLQGLWKI